VQANVGEVIAWRNLFWGLSDAMVRDPKPWIGDYVLPNMDPGNAYQIIATMAYTRVKISNRADRGVGPDLSQQPRA
jgi:aromatic ring hydroxylase